MNGIPEFETATRKKTEAKKELPMSIKGKDILYKGKTYTFKTVAGGENGKYRLESEDSTTVYTPTKKQLIDMLEGGDAVLIPKKATIVESTSEQPKSGEAVLQKEVPKEAASGRETGPNEKTFSMWGMIKKYQSIFTENNKNPKKLKEKIKAALEVDEGRKIKTLKIEGNELVVTFYAPGEEEQDVEKTMNAPVAKPDSRVEQDKKLIDLLKRYQDKLTKAPEAAIETVNADTAVADVLPPIPEVDHEANKQALIEALRKNIQEAQRIIEENERKEEAISKRLKSIEVEEKIEQEIIDLRANKGWLGKAKREQRIGALEMELDRKQHPFKYFLIKKIDAKNFRVVFGKDRKDITLEDINHVMGETGEEIKDDLTWEEITPKTDHAVIFSSNGFYLRLTNPEEVRTKKGLDIDGDDARFELVSPDGDPTKIEKVEGVPHYKTAEALFKAQVKDYQVWQSSLFRDENLES